MLRYLGCLALALAAAAPLDAEPNAPILPEQISIAVSETREMVASVGIVIWPDLNGVPFSFLFVEDQRELLVCDDRIPEGFVLAGRDERLGCNIAQGPSSWRPTSFLAAMAAFGPPSTIVMGSPQTTGKSLPDWQATIVHEHFHQWQTSLPGYFDRVLALGLAGNDDTGMWMLNYPFPYDQPEVALAHATASRALVEAIEAPHELFDQKWRAYLAARAQFQATVSPADWRYFDFQLWQEGVARWSEIVVPERSGRELLVRAGKGLRARVMDSLRKPDLQGDGRLSVYAFGAGEAMLLERARPGWRECYAQFLALGPLHDKGCTAPQSAG